MSIPRTVLVLALLVLLLPACSDDDSPQQGPTTLRTVDDLLARVCELAGNCGDSTYEEIDQCPAELLTELDAEDLAELERFLALDRAEQGRILECFGEVVCDRFGGSVLHMSDSDLMEPLRGCQ